jgi:hypothetical protein
MLYTTSLGVGNPRVATLAEQHLTDYAQAIERINEIMPGVVERELAKDGHQTNPGAVPPRGRSFPAPGIRGTPEQSVGLAESGAGAEEPTPAFDCEPQRPIAHRSLLDRPKGLSILFQSGREAHSGGDR